MGHMAMAPQWTLIAVGSPDILASYAQQTHSAWIEKTFAPLMMAEVAGQLLHARSLFEGSGWHLAQALCSHAD